MKRQSGWVVLAMAAAAWTVVGAADDRATVADRVLTLTRQSVWSPVGQVRLAFRTFHPQGMVRIGEVLYVSSVEVLDRAAGKGVGHLFKVDLTGRLLDEATLGAGPVYHPGGLDYDGRFIWVPLSEYRPDSSSIIYKVDPATLRATEVVRVQDSIGAIAHNTDDRTLHGASWGSRRFYRWAEDGAGRVTRADNPSHYVDYQDCKYVGRRRMLCSGLSEFRQTPSSPPFRLGGLDLVSLADGRPIHQVPVPLWTAGGLDMTHNPVWIEPRGLGLRAYFLPEDDVSTLYIFDVNVADRR